MDLGGTLPQYNVSPSDDDADARAVMADWMSVADELTSAMRHGAHEVVG